MSSDAHRNRNNDPLGALFRQRQASDEMSPRTEESYDYDQTTFPVDHLLF